MCQFSLGCRNNGAAVGQRKRKLRRLPAAVVLLKNVFCFGREIVNGPLKNLPEKKCASSRRFVHRHTPLQVMSSKMTLGGDVDFNLIAKKTPGFVGADLSSLTKEAAVVAINRIFTRLRASPAAANPSCPPSGTTHGGNHSSSNGDTSTANVVDKPETLDNAHLSADSATSMPPKGHGAPPSATKASAGTPDATSATTLSSDGGGIPEAADARKTGGGHASNGISNALSLPQDKAGEAELAGGGAEAVGGFLSGALSPAQLAPLSVTMEDFMAAVKKVPGMVKRVLLVIVCR